MTNIIAPVFAPEAHPFITQAVEMMAARAMLKHVVSEGHGKRIPDDQRYWLKTDNAIDRQAQIMDFLRKNGPSTVKTISAGITLHESSVGAHLRQLRDRGKVSAERKVGNEPAVWHLGESGKFRSERGRKPFVMDAVQLVLEKATKPLTSPQIASMIDRDGAAVRRALRQLHNAGKARREEFHAKHIEWTWIK